MTMRQIADMVRDKNPVTLPETATVMEACRRMRNRKVGAVLVVDRHHRLTGIFTGRDAVARVLADGRDPQSTTLFDVMTPNPRSIAPDLPAIEALREMEGRGFRHLPVAQDGKILSVISRGDFRGVEVAQLDEETGFWERI